MDPTAVGFLAGVVANGFTSLIGHTLGPDAVRRSEADLIEAIVAGSETRPLLERAAAEAANRIALQRLPAHNELELVLMSPETDAIVRRVLAALASDARKPLITLRRQFSLAVASQLGVTPKVSGTFVGLPSMPWSQLASAPCNSPSTRASSLLTITSKRFNTRRYEQSSQQ